MAIIKIRRGNALLNRDVFITDKDSSYFKQWLTIKRFDGEFYFTEELDDPEITPMFDLSQFTCPRYQFRWRK